jgi:hypothetical protein
MRTLKSQNELNKAKVFTFWLAFFLIMVVTLADKTPRTCVLPSNYQVSKDR